MVWSRLSPISSWKRFIILLISTGRKEVVPLVWWLSIFTRGTSTFPVTPCHYDHVDDTTRPAVTPSIDLLPFGATIPPPRRDLPRSKTPSHRRCRCESQSRSICSCCGTLRPPASTFSLPTWLVGWVLVGLGVRGLLLLLPLIMEEESYTTPLALVVLLF